MPEYVEGCDWKLRSIVYGKRLAAQAFADDFAKHFEENGYMRCRKDHTFFTLPDKVSVSMRMDDGEATGEERY
jgi:hypothetical protein